MKTEKNLEELDYDLEIEKIVKTIRKEKAKRVLLQFPDGLKRWATAVAEELKKQTKNKVEIFIWMNTCFGACDVPLEVENLGVDLIVQFGHSDWNFTKEQKGNIKVLK